MNKLKENKCSIKNELDDGVRKLRILTPSVREKAQTMELLIPEASRASNDWVEIPTSDGFALIKTLDSRKEVALANNFAIAGTMFPVHSHPGFEIFAVYSGEMILKIDGKEDVTIGSSTRCLYYFDATKQHSAHFTKDTLYYAITIPPDKFWPDPK